MLAILQLPLSFCHDRLQRLDLASVLLSQQRPLLFKLRLHLLSSSHHSLRLGSCLLNLPLKCLPLQLQRSLLLLLKERGLLLQTGGLLLISLAMPILGDLRQSFGVLCLLGLLFELCGELLD